MASGKIDSYAKIKRTDHSRIAMSSDQYHGKYFADVNLVYPDNDTNYHLISLYVYESEQNLPATVQYIGYGKFRIYSDFTSVWVSVRAVFAISE